MPRVLLGVGSNQDRVRHIGAGLDAIEQTFGEFQMSPVYESESVGFDGNPFYNLVVSISTSWKVGEISTFLKQVEDANGRDRCTKKYSPRSLDIDILLYGEDVGVIDGVELPRSEITENAFVLRPLSDLAPEASHPVLQQTYQQLWQNYRSNQKLWPVSLKWRDRVL